MKIEEIDSSEYAKTFIDSYIPYNSVTFNLLNIKKCDRLEFLLFQEGKIKIGLIGGVKDNSLLVPYSAPFSIFSFNHNDPRTEHIITTISLLDEYLINNKFNKVQITLPPSFYHQNLISNIIFSFWQSNYSLILDDNHFFHTKDYIKYENNTIRKGVRYNIKVATKYGLIFKRASTNEECAICYQVIKKNKTIRNHPLRLTFEEINEMKNLINIDFFLVYYEEIPIASSIVYNYTFSLAHIIYWGDLPEYNCYYPMNFLALNIFRYYRDKKVEIIDLGNSSEKGVANFGLSNFKEIIGCTSAIKFTFFKILNSF
jgi:hypothetical protein